MTGGSRGIGAEVVRTLRARGDEVLAVGRDAAALAFVLATTARNALNSAMAWRALHVDTTVWGRRLAPAQASGYPLSS